MRFLITNDDGILAHGIECLAEAAQPLGDVYVVAPDREQSATSHSLTLHHPLRPVQRADRRWQVDGTPTDCVMLAVEALLDERPDFVLSGVNHGQNMGEDVLYSGTVAAAMEGRFLGTPAIAVSLVLGDGGHFRAAADLVRRIVERNLVDPLPADTILNINVPDLPRANVKGIRTTRLGFRHKSEPVVKELDPKGKPIYWIGPAGAGQDVGPGTDFHAIAEGCVSVTPLKVDLTAHAALGSLDDWLGRFR
jgi:5'-nucleotidase